MKTAATLARIAFEASVQDAGPTASRAVAEAAAAYRLSLPAARLAALDAELGRQDLAGSIGPWAAPASPAPRPALGGRRRRRGQRAGSRRVSSARPVTGQLPTLNTKPGAEERSAWAAGPSLPGFLEPPVNDQLTGGGRDIRTPGSRYRDNSAVTLTAPARRRRRAERRAESRRLSGPPPTHRAGRSLFRHDLAFLGVNWPPARRGQLA